MKNVIKSIIKKIKKGTFFDSHYIIDTLIKEHSNDYFDFIRNTAGTTRYVHGKIAKLIGRCRLVKRAGDSLSYTIHYKANPCALWQRK